MNVPLRCIATDMRECNAMLLSCGPATFIPCGKLCVRTCRMRLTLGFPAFHCGARTLAVLFRPKNLMVNFLCAGFNSARSVRYFAHMDAIGDCVFRGDGTPA